MSFNIIYVENNKDDYGDILKQIEQYNKDNSERLPLNIENAANPEELKNKLNISHRIVLSDIYYDDPETGEHDSVNCLNMIKSIVQEWSDQNNGGKPIPIIAFSRRQAQKQTLADREGLFDIWDKNTSSPEYVVWRLSKLAQEMSYVQPDSHLQYLVRKMPSGPPWHEHVRTMAQKYNSGWTEYDQIDKAGVLICEIAKDLNSATQCRQMWSMMTKWEALSRAISSHTRGHSRHVINVFWLGYFILNHERLRTILCESWSELLFSRASMHEVKDVPPLDALNNIWFYAGLFHDVCACVEKKEIFSVYCGKIFNHFDVVGVNPLNFSGMTFEKLLSNLTDNLRELVSPLENYAYPKIKSSIDDGFPDHGFVGSLYISKKISEGKQKYFVREAARAISLHNILGDIELSIDKELSWKKEPIICLLVLCDQLQTWDRERGDEQLRENSDFPVRAELLDLQIINDKKTSIPCINISINYITRRHVEKNFVIKERVENRLIEILNTNPYKALDKIQKPWPFELKTKFYMNRNYLTKINF